MAVRLVVPDDYNDAYGSSEVFGRLRERCDITIYTTPFASVDEAVERIQDAEIVETTSAAPAGRKVPLVPRHSFSLWNRYDLTKQLGVGLGVIARSKSYASISNAVKLPGYARVDAALYYRLANGIEAQLNAENLFGAHYFPTASNDNNIAPGAPRTIRATVGYRF